MGGEDGEEEDDTRRRLVTESIEPEGVEGLTAERRDEVRSLGRHDEESVRIMSSTGGVERCWSRRLLRICDGDADSAACCEACI